jgi:HK97 family phage prohead protease
MEHKSILFELKDMSKDSRTAIIAHAVYNNIDRVGDISTKGMFSSSWERKDTVDFLFNHDNNREPAGTVLRTFEDENKAYTEVKFGNWKMGDDVIAMIEAKVIKGASFGYETEKKDYKEVNGRKVRILQQVKHIETSLLTKTPANPLAGVVSLTKAEDIQDFITEMKSHIRSMENFCRNTNASDEAIKAIMSEVKQAQDLLSKYDTLSTPLITDGDSSRNDSLHKHLLLLNAKLN